MDTPSGWRTRQTLLVVCLLLFCHLSDWSLHSSSGQTHAGDPLSPRKRQWTSLYSVGGGLQSEGTKKLLFLSYFMALPYSSPACSSSTLKRQRLSSSSSTALERDRDSDPGLHRGSGMGERRDAILKTWKPISSPVVRICPDTRLPYAWPVRAIGAFRVFREVPPDVIFESRLLLPFPFPLPSTLCLRLKRTLRIYPM